VVSGRRRRRAGQTGARQQPRPGTVDPGARQLIKTFGFRPLRVVNTHTLPMVSRWVS
jgi:hypothetical protein